MIESDAPRYVSRTLEGRGAGTEIWTDVLRQEAERTEVRVEFWTQELPPGVVEQTGEAFVKLYTRLWDEDEGMMVERARALAEARVGRPSDTGATVSLGTLEELRPKLPMGVRFAGAPFRIIEQDGVLLAHSSVCPHRLGPLGEAPVEDGRVVCPWHGYAFDVSTGGECTGRRMRLAKAPSVLVDPENGQVYLDGPAQSSEG